ncbi:MAG: hypothetical protein QOD75_4030 [Blastocatellia bacterium]|nr:hypothetical protein [Blastocatellia bacterium]
MECREGEPSSRSGYCPANAYSDPIVAREAAGSVKPGVKRSVTPGPRPTTIHKSPRSGRQLVLARYARSRCIGSAVARFAGSGHVLPPGSWGMLRTLSWPLPKGEESPRLYAVAGSAGWIRLIGFRAFHFSISVFAVCGLSI